MGFWQEMKQAVRQGQEQAAAQLAAVEAERVDQAQAELAVLAARSDGAAETFVVGLGAIYRETFLSELTAAAEQRRLPAYLFCCALPPEEVESVAKLLRRDFDARDCDSVAGAAAALESQLGLDEDYDALLITRGTWLVTAAAGADLVDREQTLELAQPFVRQAVAHYPSWPEYGRHFLLGERRAPGSNPLGRRALAKTVDALVQTPGSPWQDHPWPTPPHSPGPTG